MKRFIRSLVATLIAHAMKTPFFHLPGYMERYWLVKPRWWTLGCGVRVHRILRSDRDRDLHDHPWPFVSIILKGGYFEERPIFHDRPDWARVEPTVTRWHPPGSILVRRSRARHRLVLPRWRDAWSLFIMGPKLQSWGFYTATGKVHWRDYLPSHDATYQREQLDAHQGAE